MIQHATAPRYVRPSARGNASFTSEGALFDHERRGISRMPVWEDEELPPEPEPAYPFERQYLSWANRHPIALRALFALGIVGLALAFIWKLGA